MLSNAQAYILNAKGNYGASAAGRDAVNAVAKATVNIDISASGVIDDDGNRDPDAFNPNNLLASGPEGDLSLPTDKAVNGVGAGLNNLTAWHDAGKAGASQSDLSDAGLKDTNSFFTDASPWQHQQLRPERMGIAQTTEEGASALSHRSTRSASHSSTVEAPKQLSGWANHTQRTAFAGMFADPASMNLAASVPSNGFVPDRVASEGSASEVPVSDGTLMSSEVVPHNQAIPDNQPVLGDIFANKNEARISTSSVATPVSMGSLAFALRLKNGGAAEAIGASANRSSEPDINSPAGESARALLSSAAGRSLDVIFNGSSKFLSEAPNDTLDSRTSDRGAPSPSASSFTAQLKALIGGLSGREPLSPTSDAGVPSSADFGSRDPVNRNSTNSEFTGRELSSVGLNSGLTIMGSPKAGAGSSLTPPAAGTIRSNGLLDAGLLVGAQTEMANGSPRPATSASTTATAAAESLPEKETAPSSEPVRSVRLQLSGGESQRVDMRLVERGGTLSVSVRSTDETLTRSLQENLPELNSRLAAQHFQTETWTPDRGVITDSGGNGHSGTGAGSNPGSGSNGSGESKQGGSSPDGRSGPHSHSGQSRDGRGDGRPAWVRQLAGLDEVPQMASGEGSQIGN
jgi:hypothetical protein